MAISMTEKFTAPVPVHLIGDPDGVKLDGGMIEHSLHEVMVAALPGQVPTEITVDITELRIGHSIHVRDLTAEASYEFVGDPDAVICSCVVTRAAMSATTGEGEEGEEGESAEPALVGEESADDAGDDAAE
jgi:large subunit ribosomal protein L25